VQRCPATEKSGATNRFRTRLCFTTLQAKPPTTVTGCGTIEEKQGRQVTKAGDILTFRKQFTEKLKSRQLKLQQHAQISNNAHTTKMQVNSSTVNKLFQFISV
jgi:adenylosuccinate synthase